MEQLTYLFHSMVASIEDSIDYVLRVYHGYVGYHQHFDYILGGLVSYLLISKFYSFVRRR